MNAMLIMYFNDGLGNQMFQFALYEKLKHLGKDVVVYDNDLRKKSALHNGLELERVFGLKYDRIEYDDFKRYDTTNFVNHVIRKLLWEKKYIIYEEKQLSYDNTIYGLDNCCLKGYWQSEKYFEDIKEIIKTDYTFPEFTDQKNVELAQRISTTQSVAVHVRRGDYISKQYYNSFGVVCSEQYYVNALRLLHDQIGEFELYVFSNDIEWCKELFKNEKATYVTGNTGKNSYRDMQLMALCKHQIIANSSFSWWAAWLNNNQDKIIVSPKTWINGQNVKDIWCKEWIRID